MQIASLGEGQKIAVMRARSRTKQGNLKGFKECKNI